MAVIFFVICEKREERFTIQLHLRYRQYIEMGMHGFDRVQVSFFRISPVRSKTKVVVFLSHEYKLTRMTIKKRRICVMRFIEMCLQAPKLAPKMCA